MHTRSWLLVPGDSEKKLAKAPSTGADAVVVDLADFVPAERKATARALALEWLSIHRHQITGKARMGRWVRINPLESRMWRDDLVAVMAGAPEGIILPRACGPEAIRQVAAELYELEQVHHLPNGSVRILPVAGETPASALGMAAWLDGSMPRLAGLTWAPHGLAASIGALRSLDARGGWTGAFAVVRAQALMAAHASGLAAVETFHADWTDLKGLKAAVRDGRADGFTGMLAIHPAQVPVINAAYAPGATAPTEVRAPVETGSEDAPVFGRRGDEPARLHHGRGMAGLEDGPLADAPSAYRAQRPPILRPA